MTVVLSMTVRLAALSLMVFLNSSLCLGHYTDEWAVQIKDQTTAERVARDTNCIVQGKTADLISIQKKILCLKEDRLVKTKFKI